MRVSVAAVCVILSLMLLAGCQPRANQMRRGDQPLQVAPTAATENSATNGPAGVRTPEPAPSAPTEAAQVVRVIDGDTILVELDGRPMTVRYIGVDTPESVASDRPVECVGKEASARNQELVAGKQVRLEKDVSEADRFGRALRYVWLDTEMVNARLVQEGYAQAATFPPDVRHADLFRRLQREAHAARRGLWGACATPVGEGKG